MGTDLRRRLLDATDLTERRVEPAGIPTAVLEGGDGQPLVLLHGQGENWAVWLPVLGELQRTHRVVAVDLPGHGASATGARRLDRDSVLTWLDELLTTTCTSPPALVGHLLGGAIAARYAVAHPDRLAHLVLVDTLGLRWFRPAARFAASMALFIARPTERSRDRLFAHCFDDMDRAAANVGDPWNDLLAYALEQARRPESQAALRELMARVGAPPIPGRDLARITTPTTLVHGRGGLQVPLEAARTAARRHGWPLHVIEDARDDPAAEQPARFLAVLRAALDLPTATDAPTGKALT